MKQKRSLKSKERDMISFIYETGGFVSANEISKETRIAYVTVQKYIKEFLKKEILIEEKSKQLKKKTTKSQTKRYSINPEVLK
ncbi:MAG: MarR family transcriptional regulator [Candidatus Pacearchaeota archaeon]|nr:MarR family transcriptional regulator [Candidatus Pacearchaeota archaeon]